MIEVSGFSNLREVGAGGQAKVYAATQDAFDRQVAIKVLLPEIADDQDFVERFLREAKTVASLSHPNIISVFDFGQREGTFFMAMDFLAGGDLSGRIEAGSLTEDEILKVTSQVASALHFAHEKGHIHRDVKPDNIMFREDGSAVLTDFGIARKQDASNQLTIAGQVLGTPKYMSPEQLQDKKVDGRADIYSLGIMFYQMITGKCPYEDPDFTTLAMKHLNDPIPKLPKSFAKYQNVFERMVAKQPDKRFNNAQEIVTLLNDIRAGKVNVEEVESAAAVQLKKQLADKAPADAKAKTGTIGNMTAAQLAKASTTRDSMILLQDIDPLFDLNWQKIVTTIVSKISKDKRKYIFENFLEPKGITYDSALKKFVFQGRAGVEDVAKVVTNNSLRGIIKKLADSMQMMSTARDANAFADLIEGSISIIDNFDPKEDIKLQKEKLALKKALLDDLVLLTRGMEFEVPKNTRSLTPNAIKAYIIHVFLKQKVQGYRFKTMSLTLLDNHKHPYIQDVVSKEARLRQCDVIEAEGYMYLIGPVKDLHQNPFSIRRFLAEETVMRGSLVYYNVVALPLSKISDEHNQQVLTTWIQRIVTLERQLSQGIITLVADMEHAHANVLGPLLLKKVEADGTDIERAIEKRLMDFEKKLSTMILGRVPKGLNDLAVTSDDFEFLFISLRKVLIDIACDIRDFAAQSTSVWSQRANELDWKMMSYIKLLEKRKGEMFVKDRPEIPPQENAKLLLESVKNLLAEKEPEIDKIREQYEEAVALANEPEKGFGIWLKKKLNMYTPPRSPEQVHADIDRARHKCLISLIKLFKRYSKIVIYLEFEDLVEIDEHLRHYCIPYGDDGVGRLPILFTLYEEGKLFDIPAIRKMIDLDILKAG